MSHAIYLTDTLYFIPQGSNLHSFVFLITSCPLRVLLANGMATVRDTPPAPIQSSFHVGKLSVMAGLNWNTKPAVSKAPLCRFIHDLSGKSWVIRKASIDVLWGAWPSAQRYSITVIFHCGQTWTQSLTTALGIWRYFSLGCFSLLHHSSVHWFGFMCDPKLFTSALMQDFYGVVMEKFIVLFIVPKPRVD